MDHLPTFLRKMRAKEDANAWSVSECVLFLKSSFRDRDFDKVEAILTSKEERARWENEDIKEQLDLIRMKYEIERLERIAEEDDLTRECAVLLAKTINAERRCDESLEEVKRLTEQNKEMSDLRRTVLELKRAKDKAEEELQSSYVEIASAKRRVYELECDEKKVETDWRRKCDDLHERVSLLEKDVEDLQKQDTPEKEMAEANLHLSNGGNGRSPSQSIVEIADSDDDSAAEVISTPKATTLQRPAGSAGSSRADVEMGSGTLKRRRDEAFNSEDDALSSRGDKADRVSGPANSQQGIKTLRSCEVESGSKPLSRDHMSRITFEGSGNECEVSSDSGDSDSDSDCDRWMLVSEMVDGFKVSTEHCMETVSALHRMEKSKKRTPLSLPYSNRGFDKSNAARGTASSPSVSHSTANKQKRKQPDNKRTATVSSKRPRTATSASTSKSTAKNPNISATSVQTFDSNIFSPARVFPEESFVKYGLEEVVAWLSRYNLIDFLAKAATGYPLLVIEFYRTLMAEKNADGTFVSIKVQHSGIDVMFTRADICEALQVDDDASENSDRSIINRAYAYFFPDLSANARVPPRQISSMLFSTLSHRALHWIVTGALFPKKETHNVTWHALCLMYKIVQGMNINLGHRVIEHMTAASRGSYKEPLPYLALVSSLFANKGLITSNEKTLALKVQNQLNPTSLKKSGFIELGTGQWQRCPRKHSQALDSRLYNNRK